MTEAATGVTLSTADTTDTDLKITWTDPPSASVGKLLVSFDDGTEYEVSTGVQEYTFTGLSAGQSGTCKVKSIGNTDCESQTEEAELDTCATKDVVQFTAGTVTSSSVEFDISVPSPKTFTVDSLPTVTPGPVTASSDTPVGGSAQTSYTISASGLTALTKYTFAFSSLTKGTSNDLLDDSPDFSICTGEWQTLVFFLI